MQHYSQHCGGGIGAINAGINDGFKDGIYDGVGGGINIKDAFKCVTKDASKCVTKDASKRVSNSTSIVGPSFCGKTHLLLNKLQILRLNEYESNSPPREIHIITRSPEHYEGLQSGLQRRLQSGLQSGSQNGLQSGLEDNRGSVKVEQNVGDLEMYKECCVVFDDISESNQKLIDPFFTGARHNLCDVYYLSQSYFEVPKQTIRNNSNIIIVFRQTLKDLQHVYGDLAGYNMSCNEFKNLCREIWKEKYNHLGINMLDDKNES